MFIGEYEHSLDAKGRVVLPVSFRAHVAEKGYVAPLDGCIGLWSEDGFRKLLDDTADAVDEGRVSPDTFRLITRKAREVRLDNAGRITLPRDLLDWVGFGTEVVLAGSRNRVEIWPKPSEGEVVSAEAFAQQMTEVVSVVGFN